LPKYELYVNFSFACVLEGSITLYPKVYNKIPPVPLGPCRFNFKDCRTPFLSRNWPSTCKQTI